MDRLDTAQLIKRSSHRRTGKENLIVQKQQEIYFPGNGYKKQQTLIRTWDIVSTQASSKPPPLRRSGSEKLSRR